MSYGPEEGNDHTCPDCGRKWWDSDGGCGCTKCRHCGKVGDEDFASDGYCADCKDAEIEELKRDYAEQDGDIARATDELESANAEIERLKVSIDNANKNASIWFARYEEISNTMLNSGRDRLELYNRIRALEFQNAELRSKA